MKQKHNDHVYIYGTAGMVLVHVYYVLCIVRTTPRQFWLKTHLALLSSKWLVREYSFSFPAHPSLRYLDAVQIGNLGRGVTYTTCNCYLTR